MYGAARPDHPRDGLTLSGSIQISPPLEPDEIELLQAVAIASFRAAVEDTSSALVDQLAPAHPDGPSSWVPCEDGCCIEIDDRGFAMITAIEPWLRHIVGALLSTHAFDGALVMYDHADRSFSALTVAGNRVRRQALLKPPSRSRRQGSLEGRPRLVVSG